jgi:kynurenine formamidase
MVGEVRILNKRVLRERHKRAADAELREAAADGRVRIDLSHVVDDGMIDTGTSVAGAPDGFDLAGLPLDRLAELDGVVVNVAGHGGPAIDRAQLLPYDVEGRAVLIHTGWDRHWGTDAYGDGHPFLTEDAAIDLRDRGARLVGIDSRDIDAAGGGRAVHSTLLAAGVPVCVRLANLGALPTEGFRFTATPVKVRGVAAFPVRAFATLDAARGGRDEG